MTTDSPTVTLEQLDREIASRSFPEFLKFVKILEPPTTISRGGVIPFEMWDHLIEFVDALAIERLIAVLKSRQLGFSWTLAAYALWTAQFKEGANVLAFSQGQLEATVFLGKSRFIHDNLPEHLTIPLTRDNDTTMEFSSMKSKIVALPSTEKAGRGEMATLVIWDEAEFHENLDLNYAAAKPAIDAGGQAIFCSTPLKKTPASLFKEIVRGAKAKINGFFLFYAGWTSRKDRDQKWWDDRYKEAPTTEGISPELYMEQEHHRTFEEALAPSRVIAAFDVEALEAMQEDVKAPVETRNGVVNIYQKHAVAKRYAAGTDTSHGTGFDNATTAVIDVETGYVVADIDSSSLSPEHLAMESVNLLKDYGNPIWGIEDNDWGILTIKKAEELGYPRIYEPRNANGTLSGKKGWHTDLRTRPLLWGELIEAIRERLIIIPSKLGLAQFSTVIRNPEKDGRIEAMVGTHDDYPMAVGLAWQMRKEAYTRGTKIKVITRAERMRRMGKAV